MSPSEAEINKDKRVLEDMNEARAAGKIAVSLNGRIIDYAPIRQAEVLVENATKIANR